MNEATAAVLRAPFPPEKVGKLPRVWCGACRDAAKQRRTCDDHERTRCGECGSTMTTGHLHLDYVGHADVTDRLLQADREWTWEPVAFDSDGLPLLDRHGGLWIYLTVAGVTRIGYGHADGKAGPDAVKESIGDAIRNAAMRFGVALDLWRKEIPADDDTAPAPARTARSRRSSTSDTPAGPTQGAMRKLMALLGQAGMRERQACLDYCREVIGREIGSRNELTRAEVDLLIRTLEQAVNEPRTEAPA